MDSCILLGTSPRSEPQVNFDILMGYPLCTDLQLGTRFLNVLFRYKLGTQNSIIFYYLPYEINNKNAPLYLSETHRKATLIHRHTSVDFIVCVLIFELFKTQRKEIWKHLPHGEVYLCLICCHFLFFISMSNMRILND